ncbi:MAG TPA: ABC transporter permease [Anaerolineae bacterium]|nr:ABC transporter permease [Anaerolineae bacterium]HQK13826.1 ABC transporter permease [Anaerolineae bacterium]
MSAVNKKQNGQQTLTWLTRLTARWSWILIVVLFTIAVLVERTALGHTWLRLLFGKSALNFALRAAVPLTLGALSGVICERSGIINIGIEGMMLAGAFGAFVVKVKTGVLPLPISLFLATLTALLVGGAMAYIHALLSIRYKVNQIISGTVIITLASGLTTFFFNPDWNSKGKFGDIAIPLLSKIPVIGEVLFSKGLITYLALILVVALQVLLFHSQWGLRTRAIGEHPRAADTVGINVNRMRYYNTVVGGMLAGLAGAFLVLEAVGQFKEGMTAGRGFISLAAMIFGNWTPVGAFGAALLFGYSQALQNELLLAGVTSVPRHFISMLPYVVTIVAVTGFVGRTRPPAAEGQVYESE